MSAVYARRSVVNIVALTLSGLATLIGLIFLVWILWVTAQNGLGAIKLSLFTKITAYADQGGLSNAIVGSLIMDLMALLICAPIGVLAGTYLAEYASSTRLGATIRFLNDILLSAPSIVLGLFVYVIVVIPTTELTDGRISFSGFAGSVALALIGLPVIVRTTDEMLQLVPGTLREAALSLGIPQWKLTMQVLMRAAFSGILTGVLLALARLAGETAPLLFTAFGNNFMTAHPLDKMASMPVTIYQYTNDPNPTLHAIAWAGALLITLFVLALSLLTRIMFSRKKVSYE
ncbi:phosphate ABC transporter permease PstA [Dyella nitratireducens]|uniref:Phosphate transport system permease protein PstA n=1 Tax=Dyella nitratireducens TaxID=1849580 RepID=A0ABQ1GXP9_9GAMM|nr:phosphate ABC transporter permease PstA [Dyella nitratireducens]GGA52487.1 phosphate transport system permease protein PstA [Dyella nitratireducens]GLQ41563.1 phosphate transport system permease protein PstA [Dyella nitratireducens]